ncbi:Asp/Glu/hydantoin racemase [Advenella kashmirensis WT001]|uniref:Asp/Glu/hydantoin racemase n=1 Tax=Advenella kashmirensis (strain DSM 17095 / LMG 22695 / WT001) TaxID=1036672 RepID=I3UGE1_ADVKW|nr:aspartate/glutamate racemase family protein [Advenella kashmirensis]AFK64079.1 Asp/Glu/hydantoin racemase [Advenella kashmirensis WT001]
MKLLIINPNISTSVSDLIEAEARRAANAETQITMCTAELGVAYIETRFEALIGGYAAAILAAEQAHLHDAVIIAAFGDPGIDGLREAMNIPVVGLTEAALASACLLGQRFSIIAISPRITAWYRECVERNGLISRLASIRSLEEPLRDIGTVQTDHAERLVQLCEAAIEHDRADVIILAGAPLAGLARQVKDRIPVPVVDGVSSAVCHAQSLAILAPHGASKGSFAAPPIKPNKGLPDALSRLLARDRWEP